MKKSSTSASLIIPTYNRNAVLISAIKSVLKQEFKSYELIIVDQTLKHDTKTQQFIDKYNTSLLLRNKNRKLKYYKVAPPSLPAARNFGLNKAKSEIIIYIDDDVVLDKGFIKAHVDCYKNYPDIGAVAGRVRKKNQLPSKGLPHFNKANFTIGNFDYTKSGFVETGQGCNMSFRKSLLKAIMGFDTNYIGNAVREESDAFFRIRRLGYKVLYTSKASLLHLETKCGGCGKDESEFLKQEFYRNEVYFFLKYRNIIYLPYFLLRRFKRFVFRGYTIRHGILFKRLTAFTKGLIYGTDVYLNPKKQLTCKLVEKD